MVSRLQTKGWWTYEFCYRKFIKQYHVENGRPSGAILVLGSYESEFDWSNRTESEQVRFRPRVLPRGTQGGHRPDTGRRRMLT